VEFDAVQGGFVMVQRKEYVSGPPAGSKSVLGSFTLLNWVALVDGPDATDHVPVPTTGVFAPNVSVPPSQVVCVVPAKEGVGGAMMATVAVVSNSGQVPAASMM